MSHAHQLTDDVDSAGNEMHVFCHRLLDHSQYKSWREITTGSSLEIPENQRGTFEFNLDSDRANDVDRMYYPTSFYAIPRGRILPGYGYRDCRIVWIDTVGIHSGYARLIEDEDMRALTFNDIHNKSKNTQKTLKSYTNDHTRHGPAILGDLKRLYTGLPDNNLTVFNDHVYCVHCPYWPGEASEWVTRHRSSGQPTNDVIRQAVKYGCDFVQLSHKLSSRRAEVDEWRFSFSKAELIVVGSYSRIQRVVYRSLRLLFKTMQGRTTNTHLCTYYFKTLVMWACEEKSAEFWSEELLFNAVCELIIKMMMWLMAKSIPNYFIPSNNMIDHLTDVDVSEAMDALENTLKNIQLIVDAINVCRVEEDFARKSVCRVELPIWLKRSVIIFNRVNNLQDTFNNIFDKNLSSDLQKALVDELSCIYFALCLQWSTVLDCPGGCRRIEEYLTKAASQHKTTELDILVDYDRTVGYPFLPHFFWKSDSSVPTEITCSRKPDIESIVNVTSQGDAESLIDAELIDLDDLTHEKLLLYSRFMNKPQSQQSTPNESDSESCETNSDSGSDSAGDSVNSIHIACHVTLRINEETEVDMRTIAYAEWPGTSPSVNIAWFVAKAYLANLYYLTAHDRRAATEICDELVAAYRKSYGNQQFAERTFPVTLSTKWAAVYDNEIQLVLGFYSLCTFCGDHNRSVFLGICPVLFALYVRVRCADNQPVTGMDAGLLMQSLECLSDFGRHVEDYVECDCSASVNNGKLALVVALAVALAQYEHLADGESDDSDAD